jgi:multicomponent K+:H+ antiporter subunit C
VEIILALSIGALASSGIWLLLRSRTYQVLIGFSLLSYAVNIFIFSMGRVRTGEPPILNPHIPAELAHYTDPVPQALVLTAIVITFAMTALVLVVLLAARGLARNDHVDGRGGGR